MKFENTFAVDAPIDEVYATLLDVERVAPCVPGAEVLE
jgi:carbon monoxide dehydrogenase subunit G